MPSKAPSVVADYGFDYTAELAGDAIAASEWSGDDELTLTSDTFDDTSTTVWVGGGAEGQTLTATNEITTAAGREFSRTLTFFIRQAVDEDEDYLAIAADMVARYSAAPDPLTSDYLARAARAERLIANYLTQTQGFISGAALTGTGSVSFSENGMKNVKAIVAQAMGDYASIGRIRSVPTERS